MLLSHLNVQVGAVAATEFFYAAENIFIDLLCQHSCIPEQAVPLCVSFLPFSTLKTEVDRQHGQQ